MATCNYIKEAKQTAGAMGGVLRYIAQEKKTVDEDGRRYLTGINCVTDLAYQSFMATKNLYHKTDGAYFYHYDQSFSPDEAITPEEAHKIALELAEKFFPGCEVLVATHLDAPHLHSHFVINSVHPDTGKKLHFSTSTLEEMRQVSDQICEAHGLSTLKPYQQKESEKGPRAGEYRAAMRSESWKFQLIITVEQVMERVGSKEEFLREMRRRGYEARWEENRKSITYTTPTGMKCRDDKLHELKFKKEMMEREFQIRKEIMEHEQQLRTAEQRLEQTEKSDEDGAELTGAAGQHPLHDARGNGGTAGGRPAEDAGAAGGHPRHDEYTGDQGKSDPSGNENRADGLAGYGAAAQPGNTQGHGAGPVGDEAGVPTGWEEARRVYEETLRYGEAAPEPFGGYTGAIPEYDPVDDPDLSHRVGSGQHPAETAAEVTDQIIRLLVSLEGPEPYIQDCTTQKRPHTDRKVLEEEWERKHGTSRRGGMKMR
jgi:hypothetical protein